MAITRWEPFQDLERWEPHWREPWTEFERIQRQMNRLLDRFRMSGDGGEGAMTFVPSAEMEETDDAIRLRLEVPGMDSKDLDVQVTEGSVIIKGERKSETKTEEKGMVRSEFHYGRFERVLPLPAHIQPDKTQAECHKGILTITLPKVDEEKRKVVKVNVG